MSSKCSESSSLSTIRINKRKNCKKINDRIRKRLQWVVDLQVCYDI